MGLVNPTERKRAEEALRESEKRLRNTLDNMLEGCQIIGFDWRYLYVNDAVARHGRRTKEELLGHTMMEMYPGIEETEMFAALRRCMGKRIPHHMENEFTFPDGSKGWFELSIQPVPEGIFILSFDITDRKRAEEELRRVNRALRVLSECNQTVIRATEESDLLHEICRIIVEVGGYRLAWVGFTEQDEEKTIRPVAQVGYEEGYLETVNITWADTERGRGPTGKAIRSGVPSVARNILTDPDFEPWRAEALKRGYASSIALPLIGNGRTIGALNVYARESDAFDGEELKLLTELADDLAFGIVALRMRTEHKQAEEQMRRLAVVVIDSNDAITVQDLDGTIMAWNQGAERMYGYSEEEALGMNIVETVPEEKRAQANGFIAQMRSGNLVESLETQRVSKEGRVLDVWLTISRLRDDEGNISAIATTERDITERKRAGEALKEYSERLEDMVEERTKELLEAQEQLIRKEKSAILGQLAGGVAHELRNTLGVISNAVYYLKTILPDADETTKEYLRMISSEVRHGEKMISDLLDLSRISPALREEMTVSELVGQALEKRPPPEKVKVITKIASDLPPVFVDPRQIGQVLVNLVTNAYQAMPEGGRLTISAQAEKEQVYLSITDTGCGISKENMKMLFKPLFTTKAKGIGLGLAVSKNLVEANGGSIEVESPSTSLRTGEEGKGSTFTVTLPTKEGQA